MHTKHTIAALIQDRWENDIPDQVLNALRPYQGRLITTRLLDKLPGGKTEWRMLRNYGWTEIENRAYRLSQGSDQNGVRLIIANSESAVPLDLAVIEERNVAYFAARRERNHARLEARNDGDKLDQLAAVMNRIASLRAALMTASVEFDRLTEYGTVFEPDRYALQRAVDSE